MHWASDREVRDLRAALAYLRTRPDRDPAGFGLFGVSRGGTTALWSRRPRARRLGRDHRRRLPDDRHDDGLHPAMGRAVPAEPVAAQFDPADGSTACLARSGRRRSERRSQLPLPRPGEGGGAAGAPALADDPRRSATPTSARRSSRSSSIAATGPGRCGWSRTPSTTAAASASPRPTPAACSTSSTDTPRAGRSPNRPSPRRKSNPRRSRWRTRRSACGHGRRAGRRLRRRDRGLQAPAGEVATPVR